jgi:hypothetical protein
MASPHPKAQLVQVVLEVQELLVQLAQPRVLEVELQALAALKVLELALRVLTALKVLQVVLVDWELIQQEALDRSALLMLLMAQQVRV